VLLAVGGCGLAVGGWELAVGGWGLAVGGWGLAAGSWHAEQVYCQVTETQHFKMFICL